MSQQTDSPYVHTQQYTRGATRVHQQPALPLPAEWVIPQPDPVTSSTHCFPEGEFVPHGFFDRIGPEWFSLPTIGNEWNYTMRREAQKILPFLYLGQWHSAKDRHWLRSEGFTFLLAVRDERMKHISGEAIAADLGIESKTMAVPNPHVLISIMPHVIRLINDHISSPGPGVSDNWPRKKIFVFCETGNRYSAMVLVAYLMVMLNYSLQRALQVVHLQRLSVEADEESRLMLASFETIIDAKRNVEEARRASKENSGSMISPQTVCGKRSYAHRDENEAMEDHMDMGDDGDAASQRRPVAPFQDRWT
ncbi:hypothetical protein BBP40_000083 [Aspergillus hancockii]|nr:hypothetical protein BBP40_000083 [Aspergillus hancockii]